MPNESRTKGKATAAWYAVGDLESAHNVLVDALWGYHFLGETAPKEIEDMVEVLRQERVSTRGAIGRPHDLTPPPLRRI